MYDVHYCSVKAREECGCRTIKEQQILGGLGCTYKVKEDHAPVKERKRGRQVLK